MNITKVVSKRLKEIMEEKGISASSLSQKSGLSLKSIYNLKHAKCKRINTKTMIKIVKALNMTLSQFFEDKNNR